MYDQLQAIEDRYEELGELLSDPEVISDTKRFMQLSKEEANTRETVEVYRRYKEVVQGITDTEELLGEKLDDEMAELAKEELSELKKEDQKRASYYNYYTGSTWGDCADYDMIINVGRCGIDKAVELIANYIK